MPAKIIKTVRACQVYDSRGNPTVEAEITLASGASGRGIVPSGASTGIHEALELRDGAPDAPRGKNVLKAVAHVNDIIAPRLAGMDAAGQETIDRMMIELDGTPNKSRLGANAILACSLAAAHAAANDDGLPLFKYLGGEKAKTIPVPMVQIIGGGAHAIDTTDIQDYLVIPMNAASFAEGYAMVVDVYNATKKLFKAAGKPLSVADEGGFWPTGFTRNEEALEWIMRGIAAAGYEPGRDIALALDVASSEFYDKATETYHFRLEKREFTRAEFVDLLCDWAARYPIVSIEDGCSELDWEGSKALTRKLGDKVQLIGDDLFTTNIARIRRGIAEGACNSVLIKINQIGTLTETLEAVAVTQAAGYRPVISARSGETEDATIAHLAVATNAGQLKVGSVTRSERTAKWNEVIRIERLLGADGIYPSGKILSPLRRA